MKHSEICPVCKGTGIYKEYYDYVNTTGAFSQRTCHGCLGKGWIVIEDSSNPYRHPDQGPEILYNQERSFK